MCSRRCRARSSRSSAMPWRTESSREAERTHAGKPEAGLVSRHDLAARSADRVRMPRRRARRRSRRRAAGRSAARADRPEPPGARCARARPVAAARRHQHLEDGDGSVRARHRSRRRARGGRTARRRGGRSHRAGVGTSFELVIPPSLASIEALIVETGEGGRAAAIPLDACAARSASPPRTSRGRRPALQSCTSRRQSPSFPCRPHWPARAGRLAGIGPPSWWRERRAWRRSGSTACWARRELSCGRCRSG